MTVRLLSAGVRWEYVVRAGFHGDVSSDVEDVEGVGGGVVVLVAGGGDVEAGRHALAWFELAAGDLLGELVSEFGVPGWVGGLCPWLGGASCEERCLVVAECGDEAGGGRACSPWARSMSVSQVMVWAVSRLGVFMVCSLAGRCRCRW